MHDSQNGFRQSSVDRAVARGAKYAAAGFATPPCSTHLFEAFGYGACERHYFLKGFERAKTNQLDTAHIDLRRRECRCDRGCNQDIFGQLGIGLGLR